MLTTFVFFSFFSVFDRVHCNKMTQRVLQSILNVWYAPKQARYNKGNIRIACEATKKCLEDYYPETSLTSKMPRTRQNSNHSVF